MTPPPFAVLKLSFLLVLTALLLLVGGALWSRHQALDADTALQQQQTTLNASQQTLDRSRQQQKLVDIHLADYQALAARGFVGAEDRLAWIEAAQLANRDVGLSGLDYRLAPRSESAPELAQGLPLGQTSMTLILPLLVETDLVRYLTALKSRAPGIYHVQSCQISRQDNAPFKAINQPNLRAECELLWFTVPDKTGGAS